MTDEYLFISDCHLDPARPEVTAALESFLEQRAVNAARLYILGDLFEAWLGDDDPAPEYAGIIGALRRLAATRPVYFLAGNRDFLLGEDFAADTGIRLLHESEQIRLGERQVLLLHGDTLCTDDHDYLAFRAQVRAPAWQTAFLAKPLAERRQIAARLRSDSVGAMAQKSSEIMDVNPDAVLSCFETNAVDTIIHGHTHRPALHRYPRARQRIVLGDWNPGPSYLSWREPRGFELADPRVART